MSLIRRFRTAVLVIVLFVAVVLIFVAYDMAHFRSADLGLERDAQITSEHLILDQKTAAARIADVRMRDRMLPGGIVGALIFGMEGSSNQSGLVSELTGPPPPRDIEIMNRIAGDLKTA
jgi:hypothetical protein